MLVNHLFTLIQGVIKGILFPVELGRIFQIDLNFRSAEYSLADADDQSWEVLPIGKKLRLTEKPCASVALFPFAHKSLLLVGSSTAKQSQLNYGLFAGESVYHCHISTSTVNSSDSDVSRVISLFQSIGFFFLFFIIGSRNSVLTVFRHDLKFHLRVFRFMSSLLFGQADDAIVTSHQGHGVADRGCLQAHWKRFSI